MTEHTNDTAQAYPPPGATVNGADALDLLPVGTVVRDRDTSEWKRLDCCWTWSGMRRTAESLARVYGPLTVVSVPEPKQPATPTPAETTGAVERAADPHHRVKIDFGKGSTSPDLRLECTAPGDSPCRAVWSCDCEQITYDGVHEGKPCHLVWDDETGDDVEHVGEFGTVCGLGGWLSESEEVVTGSVTVPVRMEWTGDEYLFHLIGGSGRMTGHGNRGGTQDGRTPVPAGPGGPDASSGADGAPVSPSRDGLVALMRKWGWRVSGSLPNGRADLWEHPNGMDEIVVPNDETAPDYARLLERVEPIIARAEGPRLLGVVREVEALHSSEPGVSNGVPANVCRECLKVWPCPTARAVQALTETTEETNRGS